MRRATIAGAALPVACLLVACASDVWLGDLPVADGGTVLDDVTAAPEPAESALPPLTQDADVRDVVSEDAHEAVACTKDCHGQPCVDGLCQPIALATAQPGVLYLAIDDIDIFWGTTGHTGLTGDPNPVAKTTKVPGGAVVVLSADGSEVRGITVDAMQVYWVRQGTKSASLSRASKIDGSGRVLTGIMPNATNVQGLVRDSVYLYAVNGTELRVFQQTDVTSMGFQFVGTFTAGAAAAHDGDSIFVADPGGAAVDFVTKSTHGMKPVAGLGDAPVDVAFDATHVYFAAKTTVGRISRTTNAVETIANGLTGAAGIAVDANFVYFTTTNEILRAAKGTTVTTTLATGLTKGGRLVVDDTFVYFADFGKGVIGRVPK